MNSGPSIGFLPYPVFLRVLKELKIDTGSFAESMTPDQKTHHFTTLTTLGGCSHEQIEAAIRRAIQPRTENTGSTQVALRGMPPHLGGSVAPAPAPAPSQNPRGARVSPRLFLCYNRLEEKEVVEFEQALLAENFSCERDVHSFVPGQSYWKQIQTTASKCSGFLVFFGQHGISDVHRQEIEYFHTEFPPQQRPLIPVLLRSAGNHYEPRGSDPRFEYPWYLKSIHHVDLRQLDLDEAIDKIKTTFDPNH